MSGIPVLDFDSFVERVGGEREFALELLEDFIQDLAKAQEELPRLLEEGDAGKVLETAHSLKGAAMNLSATALSEAARLIEFAARESDLEKAGAYCGRFATEVGKLKSEVEKLR